MARAAASFPVPCGVSVRGPDVGPPPPLWPPPWRGALRCRGAEGVSPPGVGARVADLGRAGSYGAAAGTKAGGSRAEAAASPSRRPWIGLDRPGSPPAVMGEAWTQPRRVWEGCGA